MKLTITFLLVILTTVVRSQTVSCSDPFLSSDWTGIGPYEYTKDNQQGRVMSIWVDPENEDEIYVGTRGSGIWYTYDGGEHWANQTGFQLPATGAWSIRGRRVIAGPTMLYASRPSRVTGTGLGELHIESSRSCLNNFSTHYTPHSHHRSPSFTPTLP